MSKFTELPQFKRGMNVERWLDRFFRARGWKIKQTTEEEERKLCLGDRHFAKNGHRLHMEYKSGIQTGYTGNIFLETISVDDPKAPKDGWVLTSRADYIVYATLLNGCLLIFRPNDLRKQLPGLRQKFPEKPTSNNQNDGYNTHGLVVPFEWAQEHLAIQVLPVDA